MAKLPKIPLYGLINRLLQNKSILSCEIYSTFQHIPEEYLTNDEKSICYAFMTLSKATRIFDQESFLISHKLIGLLSGISRDKAKRIVPQLPGRLAAVTSKKLLGPGERISFKILDQDGNQLQYAKGEMKNKDGMVRVYSFRYLGPRDEHKFDAEVKADAELDKLANQSIHQSIPDYNHKTDPDYKLKKEAFENLSNFFTWSELNIFLPYPLDKIVKVSDYYFRTKAEKAKQKKAGVKSDIVLSFGWLKGAFEKYNIPDDKAREKLIKEMEWFEGIQRKINEAVKDAGIKTNFKLERTTQPKKFYKSISSIPDEHLALMDKLSKLEQDELDQVAAELYRHLESDFTKHNISEYHAIPHIKKAIVFRHFNII